MKGKGIFRGAFVIIIIFIIVAIYFWYRLFMGEYKDLRIGNSKIVDRTKTGLVLESINNLNLVNEESHEDGSDVEGYTFKVINEGDFNQKYHVLIENVPYNVINDGCSASKTLKREELSYQLKKNNRTISSGILNELEDNLLDYSSINKSDENYYELKIWINDDATEWQSKHYHYKLSLKEV